LYTNIYIYFVPHKWFICQNWITHLICINNTTISYSDWRVKMFPIIIHNVVHLIFISYKIQSKSYYCFCFLKIILEINNKVSLTMHFIRFLLRIPTKTLLYNIIVYDILILRKLMYSGLVWWEHFEKWSSKVYYLQCKKLVIFSDLRKNTAVILFTRNHKKGPKVYDASFILSSHSGALNMFYLKAGGFPRFDLQLKAFGKVKHLHQPLSNECYCCSLVLIKTYKDLFAPEASF
jgi:hypothetical protein